MPTPEQRPYEDFLPSQASLGTIEYMTKSVTVNGKVTSRQYYSNEMFELRHHETIDGERALFIDSTPEYSEGTFTTGDEVKVSDIGLKYKYAGVEDLVVDAATLDEKHPLAKDNFNMLINRSIWVCMGVVDELKPFDGSSSSSLYSELHDIVIIKKKGLTQKEDGGIFFVYDAAFCNADIKGNYIDENDENVEYQAYVGEHQYLDKMSLLDIADPNASMLGLTKKSQLIEATLTNDDENIGNVSLSCLCYVRWTSLGSQLVGHSGNRVSDYKTVISDGAEKQIVAKSYDIFSGSVLVERADLKRTEYLLMKATQGDYVFHIGAGAQHDNRVYLGKLKYSSPIKNEKYYQIDISGQSLSFDVKNPLVDENSTSGYPV